MLGETARFRPVFVIMVYLPFGFPCENGQLTPENSSTYTRKHQSCFQPQPNRNPVTYEASLLHYTMCVCRRIFGKKTLRVLGSQFRLNS